MPEWNKPLPTISGETKPYWDHCRRGELLIQKCDSCEEYQFYPRGICANCWSNDIQWVTASGKGTVWTFTVTYQNGTRDLPKRCLTFWPWWNLKKGSVCLPTLLIATPGV